MMPKSFYFNWPMHKMTRVSACTFSKQVGEQETVKYGVIQFIDCINNLAVFVDVCPYYIMYSFVRLKKTWV